MNCWHQLFSALIVDPCFVLLHCTKKPFVFYGYGINVFVFHILMSYLILYFANNQQFFFLQPHYNVGTVQPSVWILVSEQISDVWSLKRLRMSWEKGSIGWGLHIGGYYCRLCSSEQFHITGNLVFYDCSLGFWSPVYSLNNAETLDLPLLPFKHFQ